MVYEAFRSLFFSQWTCFPPHWTLDRKEQQEGRKNREIILCLIAMCEEREVKIRWNTNTHTTRRQGMQERGRRETRKEASSAALALPPFHGAFDSCHSCQFSNVVFYLLLSASGQGGQSLHSRFPISHSQDVGRQYRAIHDAKDLREKTIPSQIMCTVRKQVSW